MYMYNICNILLFFEPCHTVIVCKVHDIQETDRHIISYIIEAFILFIPN